MKGEYSFLKRTNFLFASATILSSMISILYVGIAYFMRVLVDAGSCGDKERIYTMSWISVLYLAFYFIVGKIQVTVLNRYSKKVVAAYKKDYLQRVMSVSFSEFNTKDTGTYISALTNNAAIVEEGFGKSRVSIIRFIVHILVVVICMIRINIFLFMIAVCTFAIPVVAASFINKMVVRMTGDISDKNSKLVSGLKDFLGGFGVIKSFKAENETVAPINDSINQLESAKEKRNNKSGMQEIFSNTAILLGTVLLFLIGSFYVIKGTMTIGDLIAFLQLLLFIQYPANVLPGFFEKYLSGKKLVEQDKIEIHPSTEKLITIDALKNEVALKNVTFSYDENKIAIDNVCMSLERNGLYAVVGASGSGKSTLINLLRGYYTDYEGIISFDENDIRKIENIYDAFTVIDQNVYIFNSTIKDNISMYKNFTDEEMEQAIQLAGLRRMIDEKGLDYWCGENGSNLSGGERQRISIARALISKKQFIAMDESTSSLDIETARAIEKTIYELNGVLRLVVTHNLNDVFLKKCDRIFVMKNGRLVESGAFDELMENHSTFYNMYELWK